MMADGALVVHILAGPAETTLGRALTLGHPQPLGSYRALVGSQDRPVAAVNGDQVILGELGAGLGIDPTTTPQGRLIFRILRELDEFHCELIVEGTKEGPGRCPYSRPNRRPQAEPGLAQVKHPRKL